MGVYKKGNRFYIDYSLPDGKRKREVVSIEGKRPEDITRNDALKCLAIRQGQVAEGKFKLIETSRTMTFDRLSEVFLEGYSKVNKRSWKRDRTSCRALMEHFGGMRLPQITPWAVDKYKSKRLKDISRLKRPITKATVNRELACLKKMLSYAVGEKWLTDNPLRGYKLFQERPNKVRVITREEFQRVYNAASEFLKPVLMTAYDTGMRYSEILNLKWGNVTLREGNIFVRESKSGETRYLPISDRLKETLEAFNPGLPDEPVFQYMGKAVRSVKTSFNSAIRKSGVEKFTFHDLRHTFASVLVMNGVDITTVQELLGHKSIAMTKRYSHPTPEHKRRAIEKLNIEAVDTYSDTKAAVIKIKTT